MVNLMILSKALSV